MLFYPKKSLMGFRAQQLKKKQNAAHILQLLIATNNDCTMCDKHKERYRLQNTVHPKMYR